MIRATPGIAFAVAAAGIAVFTVMDAVMKSLTLENGVYNTAFWRTLIGVALAGTIHFARRPSRPAVATLKVHVRRGAVSTAMLLLFFWGLTRIPMAQAVALSFIAPLIALYLAAVLLDETVSPRAVFASLLALCGVGVILYGQWQMDLGREALLGAGAVLLSALLYAYNIILMRRQSLMADAVEVSFYQNAVVGLFLLCAAPFLLEWPPADAWPRLALAAILSTASLFLLSWAYARAEAHYLAPVEYTAFLWAAVLGWLVFGEHVSLPTILGAATIITACFIAARRKAPFPNLEGAA